MKTERKAPPRYTVAGFATLHNVTRQAVHRWIRRKAILFQVVGTTGRAHLPGGRKLYLILQHERPSPGWKDGVIA